ncbi:MAG: glycosyltransferase [Gammaproteobacteria bacterium]
MKLIVQVPCYNEQDTIAETIADIPRDIPGIDRVEVLVIDDGSTDQTARVAREAGADYIVSNMTNLGLARTFAVGINYCLQAGADIIVNTDGDHQYHGSDIQHIIVPILEHRADIVIGDRQPSTTPHFSRLKRLLQYFGSKVVKRLSGLDIPDPVSGLRAISREAALRLNIISSFSYTTEMVIQAGKRHMVVVSVPVTTNDVARASRLAPTVARFVLNSLVTMLRMYAMYQPLRMFFYISGFLSLIGIIPIIRYLLYYLAGQGAGHVQSLILGGVFLIIGAVAFLIGLLADLISFNRQLLELVLEKTRRIEFSRNRNNTEN